MRWVRPLYLMIKPPPAQMEEFVRLCAGLGVVLTYSRDRWHCTLLPLGESNPDLIAAIHQAMRAFNAEPFSVAFDRVEGNMLKPCKGLRRPGQFQSALRYHITVHDVKLPAYKFGLHLNLEYKNASDRRSSIQRISWPVDEILLVESVNGEGRHILRGSWRLMHRQGAFDFDAT